MARLNEATTESIDSLTRRFVRQNRDLTRANATQSIRIRALETQVHNLLAENLSLHETIVRLNAELDEHRSKQVVRNVCAIQRRLDEKLREVGSLVQELEFVDKKPNQRKSQPIPTQRSPRALPPKRNRSLGEAVSGQEGSLPTIVEGKLFPRKTLDSAEITTLYAENTSESPEIGPPPTTFFDHEELQVQPFRSSNARPERMTFDDAEVPHLFSANFETRKRRRESYVRLDEPNDIPTDRVSIDPEKTKHVLSDRPLKTAAEHNGGINDELVCSNERRQSGKHYYVSDTRQGETLAIPIPKPTSNNLVESMTAVVLQPPTQNIPLLSPKRKALQPKSANVSPRKVEQIGKTEKVKEPQPFVHEIDQDFPNGMNDSIVVEIDAVREDGQSGVPGIKEEPQTPALFDLTSPTSSHPSEAQIGPTTGRPISPRPSDARGSRRARAQVSYAEPNLISKMRRPTKELVDAVAKESKIGASQSTTSPIIVKKEESVEPVERTILRKITINKSEPLAQDWKPANASASRPVTRPEPRSPLQDKEEAVRSQISSRTTSRERRGSTLLPADQSVASNGTISTLIAPSRKAVGGRAETQREGQPLEVAMKSLDIYDIKESSPPSSQTEPMSPNTNKHHDNNNNNHNTGRPSSQPRRSSSSNSTSTTTLNRSASTGTAPRPSTARLPNRRQTLGANTRNTITSTSTSTSDGGPGSSSDATPPTAGVAAKVAEPLQPRWNGSRDLKAIVSAAAVAEGAKEVGVGGRGERLNRRRSMML